MNQLGVVLLLSLLTLRLDFVPAGTDSVVARGTERSEAEVLRSWSPSIAISSVSPVYKKVWARTGIAGNLIELLGPPSQQ